MITRTAKIGSSVGLHARPAALFVQAVQATGMRIAISTESKPGGDASSILVVMALGAQQGDVVTLQADCDGAAEALDSLVELLERDLDSA